ncbi:MAG: CBS domain-containing protein [Pseudobacteriovorax sp.]|nr:CBS domain-containing protein [Pseudobacteriovorax sp.]
MNYEPRKRLNSSHAQMSDSISSIMKRSFVCLREFDTIEDAVDILIRSKQSGAPVIDENRVVIGYLSEKECLKLVTGLRYHNGFPGYVSDHMNDEFKTMNVETNIFTAVTTFINYRYHAYPVVDNEGKIVGLLTRQLLLENVSNIKQTSWFDSDFQTVKRVT